MFIDALTPQVNIINLCVDLDEGVFILLSESEIVVGMCYTELVVIILPSKAILIVLLIINNYMNMSNICVM